MSKVFKPFPEGVPHRPELPLVLPTERRTVGKIGLKGLPVEKRLVRVRAAEIEDRGLLNRWRGCSVGRFDADVTCRQNLDYVVDKVAQATGFRHDEHEAVSQNEARRRQSIGPENDAFAVTCTIHMGVIRPHMAIREIICRESVVPTLSLGTVIFDVPKPMLPPQGFSHSIILVVRLVPTKAKPPGPWTADEIRNVANLHG